MGTPSARFDDLISGTSFRLADPVGEIVAHRSDDAVAALRAAQRQAESGRWVAAMVSYEAAPGFDPGLRVHGGDPAVPAAWFGLFERREEDGAPLPDAPVPAEWTSSITPVEHADAVSHIRELIRDGVSYQVNFSRRLRAVIDAGPLEVYAALLAAQRPAYGALLEFGDTAVVSASPELFFSLEGDCIVTRPMKGTAARGRWSQEDRAHRRALLSSAKERAENLMIVDLVRNDLGRIARFGTVRVDSLFDAEAYETVWQMTSTVSALRRPEVDLAAVFGALFPCGSVTGAPKASTMEVIAALEDSPRGAYCGAIGYIEPGARRAVFSVAIRTVTVDRRDATAVFGTGGGITWDSEAASEWDETRAKAALLDAHRPRFDLLETLRIDRGGYHRIDRHLRRLTDSAGYFGRRVDLAAVRAALRRVPAGDPPRRVRLTVDPAGRADVAVTRLEPEHVPVRLVLDHVPVDRHDPFRHHKTTHRIAYDISAQRHPDADDVVAVNERGEVVETTIGNLLVRIGGRWYTPPRDAGCLGGIEREVMLDRGEAAERPITVQEFLSAEEIHVVNSVRMRRPAILV